MGSTLRRQGRPGADVEAGAIADAIGTPTARRRAGGWRRTVAVQPRLLPDQYWPQLFQLARAEPADVALGIDVGTAVRIDECRVARPSSVRARSWRSTARAATFATGDNGAIGASWLLVDTFAAGDAVAP